jgi:hypothetical protein
MRLWCRPLPAHPQGLARLLSDAGCDVVATAADGVALLRESAHTMDAVVVDINCLLHRPMKAARQPEAWRVIQLLGAGAVPVPRVHLRHASSEAPAWATCSDRVSDVAVSLTRSGGSPGECVVDPTIVSRLMHKRRDPIRSTCSPIEREVL